MKPERTDHPQLQQAIDMLREKFNEWEARSKYGRVGIVVDFEAGKPVLIREACEAFSKPRKGP